jgi:hypothetical protein
MGHLNAVLAVGRALVEEGHEVVGLSSSVFRDRIEKIGARFHPFPGDADIDTSDMIKAYPEFAKLTPGPEMTLFYFERVFADPLAAQYQGLKEVMETFDADLVVADNLFLGALPLLLNSPANRPPIMFCGTTYLLWRRDDRGRATSAYHQPSQMRTAANTRPSPMKSTSDSPARLPDTSTPAYDRSARPD